MRIAIISSLFPPFAIGGAERIAGELALALHSLGHEVNVISTCRRGDLSGRPYRTDDWNGVRVWRVAPWNLYWRFDQARKQPGRWQRVAWHAFDLWNPSVLDPVRRILDSVRPDVVNTHNIDGLSPAVWQVARRYTSAVAHTLHDCHLICVRATMRRANGEACDRLCRLCSVYSAYHELFQRNVRALIAPSAAIAEVHRLAGWSVDIQVIRNGIDTGEVDFAEPPDGAPLRVLFLSRLEREKGCETLLRAIELFEGSRRIEFHVAGDGAYAKRFTELAARAPNVNWHGFVTGQAKHALLAGADAFLQLSECFENAPLALMEAKQYGLYVLGANIGGIPELTGGPDEGRLIPPADHQKLFAELQALCDVKQALRQGRRKRAGGYSGYGTRAMAERYVQLFRALADSTR